MTRGIRLLALILMLILGLIAGVGLGFRMVVTVLRAVPSSPQWNYELQIPQKRMWNLQDPTANKRQRL